MLAHTLARAVDAADFRLSRNGDGAEAAAVHSLRACGGAMARRRTLNAYLESSVRPDHVLLQGECDPIFDCRETAMGPATLYLETLRRTQTVGDYPKRTVLDAYP